MSTTKVVYSSINDGDDNSGEIRFSKNLKSRLKGFLRKKANNDGNNNDHNRNQMQKATTSDESLTLSDSVTDEEESPIKLQQNDNESFDRYFASSFLPSYKNTDNDMNIDDSDSNNNKSHNHSHNHNHNGGLHWRAFADAQEMEFPPPSPQQVRVRKQILCCDRQTLSKAGGNDSDNDIIILPTNLSSTFQTIIKVEATIPVQKTNNEIGKQQPTSSCPLTDNNSSVSVKDEDRNQSQQEPFKDNAMNAAVNLVTFGDDLIHTVNENQCELYSMFEKMKSETKCITLMNPFAEKGGTVEEVEIEAAGIVDDANEVDTIHMTVVDELRSLEGESKGSNNSNRYQQADGLSKLLTSKLVSIRKKMSTIAVDTKYRQQLCSLLECAAESCNNKTAYDDDFAAAATDTSPSPLDHSWLSYMESDSVSKLTEVPHDLNLSHTHSLEIHSIFESTTDNSRAMAGKRFDF